MDPKLVAAIVTALLHKAAQETVGADSPEDE
jgi:hypothetical protein